MKPLRYTTHCETAMAERLIDPDWVLATVPKPDWVVFDPSGPPLERRFRAVAEREKRILRVVCLETPDEIRIITVLFDRKARRPT